MENFVHLQLLFMKISVRIFEREILRQIKFSLDLSTLMTIETINPNLTLNNLHSLSQYYISVMICNYFDCGPSSSAINIETPSSSKF
jgi:hypothetical protein